MKLTKLCCPLALLASATSVSADAAAPDAAAPDAVALDAAALDVAAPDAAAQPADRSEPPRGDLASLLQQPYLLRAAASTQAAAPANKPFMIGLRRESVPVYRRGKIASYKTSYSGVLSVGSPAQDFRVVFDTGSGHIVLPAAECKSEACLVAGRRKFNMTASSTSTAINSDGSVVPEGETCDQVTIGFGTGEITGEFTRDKVCFGAPPDAPIGGEAPAEASEQTALAAARPQEPGDELCVEMSVILAVEMSTQPFKTFRFDGILGLGLDGLVLNSNFSAFGMLLGQGLPNSHFGVFLTEGEDGEESEIAMGGVDQNRLLEPLTWAPVAMPELGYWQVQILAVRIDGQELDVCRDGTCRGVVDTGTSHLGVPAPFDAEVASLLTREAGDTLDCRLVEAPEMEIELPGYNITLNPGNYMRRLPLREGVSVSSAQGVYVPSNDTNASLTGPSSADPVGGNATNATAQGNLSHNVSTGNATSLNASADVRRFCRPRLMPVRLPEPLGPKLFILGEPVLHRYYTVYDWANHQVGFSLANNRRNTMHPSEIVDRRGVLPKEVDVLLMQKSLKVARDSPLSRKSLAGGAAGGSDMQDEVILVQVEVKLSLRRRRV